MLVTGQKVRRPPPLPILRSDTLNYDDDEPEVIEQVVTELEEGEVVEEQEEDNDEQGWYNDGAYTAAMDPTIATPVTEPPTALSLWHNALLASFRSVRQSLHANPPTPLLPLAVSPSLPVRKQRSLWQQHIFNTHPTPKELWGIDQQTVLRLLKWLTQRMSEMAKHKNGRCWSQWLWGLLVRLDDCLTADETSIVRELGKRCLIIRERMAISLQGGRVPDDQREEEEEAECDEDEGGNEGVQELNTVQGGGTVAAAATQQPEQILDSPITPKVEEIVKSEVTPQHGVTQQPEQILDPPITPKVEEIVKSEVTLQHGVTPEAIPLFQAETPAETKEAGGLELASRLKATLQSIKTRKAQEGPLQSGQEHQSKPNAPVLQTADTLSQSDIFAVLDMVISLVGDFYGQKDLLSDRKAPIHLPAS